jgi:endonuclease I
MKKYFICTLFLLFAISCSDDVKNEVEKEIENTWVDSVYYRSTSTERPSWGTYGIPSEPTWGFIENKASNDLYSSLVGLKGDDLKEALLKICEVDVNRTNYSWYRFENTDEDPRNTNKVLTIYLGESRPKYKHDRGGSDDSHWNREHVYAKSHGGFENYEKGGGSDNHHIRPAIPSENYKRWNHKLGVNYVPREPVRGDVARMSFYVALVYDLPAERNINVPWAIFWNKNDKVDDWEMRRNNIVEKYQGNRNPFIDHPELVEYIYGSKQDEVYNLSE